MPESKIFALLLLFKYQTAQFHSVFDGHDFKLTFIISIFLLFLF